MTRALFLLPLLLSACLSPPDLKPLPVEHDSIPDCILSEWAHIEQLSSDEVQRITTGEVAPLEHGRETMNESDLEMIHWVVVWGLIERGQREGLVACDHAALGWAESKFRTTATSVDPVPTGHGLNALRRVTTGWGPLPLDRAMEPTEGDFRTTLEYLGMVIDAYLDPEGPFHLGPGRWIPPSLND